MTLYLKIERSIEKHLGAMEVEKFKNYVIVKEKLIGDRKELIDKIKLSRRQLRELEWGREDVY